MAITLTKGQKVDLTKDKPGLKTILVGLGWDEASEYDDDDIDCDASCVLLDENDRVISEDMDECCVYFANESLYGIEHGGDNLTGEGEGDDETITINLSSIPSHVKKIVVFMNIYKANERNQTLSDLENSFIRLCNSDNNDEEICRFDMENLNPDATAVIAGAIYRHNGEWKFSAIGEALEDCSYVGDVISRYGY